MASTLLTGSPKLGRKSTPTVKVLDANSDDGETPTNPPKVSVYHFSAAAACLANFASTQNAKSTSTSLDPSPLQSNKFGNLQPKSTGDLKVRESSYIDSRSLTESHQVQKISQGGDIARMEDILARLRLNDSRKVTPTEPQSAAATNKSLEKLLNNLNGSNKTLKAQAMELRSDSDSDGHKDGDRSSGSDLYTPATDTFSLASHGDVRDTKSSESEAVEAGRVKAELAAAKALIARQEQELAESRNLKHTMEQAMGPPSEADFGMHSPDQQISNMHSAFNAGAPVWHPLDDSRSDHSDRMQGRSFNGGQYNRGRNSWNNPRGSQAQLNNGFPGTSAPMNNYSGNPRLNAMSSGSDQSWGSPWGNQTFPPPGFGPSQFQRTFSGSSMGSMPGFDSMDTRLYQPLDVPSNANIGVRRNMGGLGNRGSNFSSDSSAFGGLTLGMPGGMNSTSLGPIGAPGPLGYQPRPIGAQITPTSPEFGNMSGMSQWSPVTSTSSFLFTLTDRFTEHVCCHIQPYLRHSS